MNERHTIEIEIADAESNLVRRALEGQQLVIGRSPDSHIHLDRGTVSRRHAEIYCDPYRRWWIRDLGSRNGTRVNGQLVPEHVIRPGDTLGIGEFTLKVVSLTGARAATLDDSLGSGGLDVSEAAAEISTLHEVETPRLSASHLSIISEFGQTLLRIAKPEERLAELARLMVRPEFQGRCALALRIERAESNEKPKLLCPVQSAPRWHGWNPYISRTILRAIRRKPEPVLAGNAPFHQVSAEISISPDVMKLATIACPVRVDEQAMDLLYIILAPEYGTGEWLALANLAVREYQQAESAHLSRQQESAHVAIERELQQARQIQTRLLPGNQPIPGLDWSIGFKPCRWVGGDYIDILPIEQDRHLLVCADVCGKGLAAALVAHSLHTTVRIAVRAGLTLPSLMTHLNNHLCETLGGQSFVTLLGMVIEPATGLTRSVSAGHYPPIAIASDGGMRQLRTVTTMPLGVCESEFACDEDALAPGELLVLYTDGLIDLRLSSGDSLGHAALTARLQDLYRSAPNLPACQLADQLTSLLDQLQGDQLSCDDRTFLLAKRTDTPC